MTVSVPYVEISQLIPVSIVSYMLLYPSGYAYVMQAIIFPFQALACLLVSPATLAVVSAPAPVTLRVLYAEQANTYQVLRPLPVSVPLAPT
jgi:hypothetical protein